MEESRPSAPSPRPEEDSTGHGASSPLTAFALIDVAWDVVDFPPSELLSGTPVVTVCEYWRSNDGDYIVGGARISAACVMRSALEGEERMLVVSGSVTIGGPGLDDMTVHAGDVIDLPAGVELTYTFHGPFEDIYVFML